MRVTVIGPDQQADFSVPSDVPILECLPVVLYLLGHDADTGNEPASWVLSGTEYGMLDWESTLDSAEVRDGAVLHLTTAVGAAENPFVDDVLDAVGNRVDRFVRWQDPARELALAAVSAGVVVATGVAVHLAGPAWLSGLLEAGMAALAVVAAVLAGGRHREVIAGAAVPLAALAGLDLGRAYWAEVAWSGGAAGAGTALAVVGLLGLAGPRRVGLSAGIATGTLLVTLAVVLLGANGFAVALWSTVPLVFALAYAPSMALSSSGIVALVKQADEGQMAQRGQIEDRLHTARSLVDVVVWVCAALLVVATVTVAGGPHWLQPLTAGYVGLALLLRARSFSSMRHVLPVMVAGSAAVLAAVIYGARMMGDTHHAALWICVGGLGVVFGPAVMAYRVRLDEVMAARLGRFLDAVDVVITIGYVPIVTLTYGIYQYYWRI